MSVVSALSPSNLAFPSTSVTSRSSTTAESNRSFYHETSYITLNRMLIRYQHLILLTPAPSQEASEDLTPLQRQIQAELWSAVPYYRTKWLRNIEGARNILLQLERAVQAIKVQRSKQNAQKDLAEKRMVIKKLRNRVEEIGREVEAMGEEAFKLPAAPFEDGETVLELLQNSRNSTARRKSAEEEELREGKPVQNVTEDSGSGKGIEDQKAALFNSSSTVRRRGGGGVPPTTNPSTEKASYATGVSGVNANEQALLNASREQDDITASLVSMAAQLKQQTRAFQFSLDQDKSFVDKALEGLDRNLSGMEIASKNMAFLTRMSEGEGWLGRLKLYAMIFAMWVAAILLVFVGPKLRF